MQINSITSRRGFLGSLAALIGAKVVADQLPDEPPALPVHTSGYSQIISNDGVTSTITSYTGNANTYWITAQPDPAGEGIRWNYTAGQVQSGQVQS